MKKFITLCAALLCGIVSISAKTIYCKMEHGWWTTNGAAIAAYAWNSQSDTKNATWPGVLMTHSKNDNTVWTIDIDNTKFDKVVFVRVSPEGAYWNAKTADQTIPTDDKDLFTITSTEAVWGDPGCTGEWSVYVAPVYTVAGAIAILGSEWNAADSTNDMTEQADGTYKLKKTDVLLNAGNYGYKIVVNHAWEPKLMENKTLTVEKAGYHTLTFTYNASNKAVSVTDTLTRATDPLPVLNLLGSWDGWKAGTLFTPAADKLIATATLTLDAGDYTFKVIKDAAWMTDNNSGTMTRVNSTGWTFVDGANKAATGLKADAKGDYTFTWTYETNALSVTFPAATATDLIGADSDSKAVKIVRDGQLLIVRDGVTYNMMGSVVK